jgi:Flp pilus assembly pilin Flp
MPTSFLSLVKRFAREERGAAFVEYAILVALITAAVSVIMVTFFADVQSSFDAIGDAVRGATNAPAG